MQIEKGSVVSSAAGHDAGRFYAVLEVRDNMALIADGKVRRFERPKRKSLKHLRPTQTVLSTEALTTNNQLKLALRAFNAPLSVGSPTKGR